MTMPLFLDDPGDDVDKISDEAGYQLAVDLLRKIPSHETAVCVDILEARRGGRPPIYATTPRTWSTPPEPGPEVTRVRDAYGQCFERAEAYDDDGGSEQGWLGDAFTTEGDVPDLFLSWKQLMAVHEPLTEVAARLTRLFAERFVVTKAGSQDPNVAAARAVVELLGERDQAWAEEILRQRDEAIEERDRLRARLGMQA